jgi:hypothetical protein
LGYSFFHKRGRAHGPPTKSDCSNGAQNHNHSNEIGSTSATLNPPLNHDVPISVDHGTPPSQLVENGDREERFRRKDGSPSRMTDCTV